jgi:hypothetical protein
MNDESVINNEDGREVIQLLGKWITDPNIKMDVVVEFNFISFERMAFYLYCGSYTNTLNRIFQEAVKTDLVNFDKKGRVFRCVKQHNKFKKFIIMEQKKVKKHNNKIKNISFILFQSNFLPEISKEILQFC